MSRCIVAGCRRRGEIEIVHLDRCICRTHWMRVIAEDQPAEALARAFGISVANATTMENDMSKPKKNGAAKVKATKKVKVAKEPKVKAASEPKSKKEKGPKPERTFAIRISTQELDAIHRASGARNAARFVRALTVAFVKEDESAFRSLVKDAREARA